MRSWRKMRYNTVDLGIKTPETDLNPPERIHHSQGVNTSIRRQYHDGLMRKIPVARRLAQCLLPIEKFHLERPAHRSRHFGKGLSARETFVGQHTPGNDQQICYTITVDRNLAREGYLETVRLSMRRFSLRQVCMHKGDCETVFRSGNALSSWQIASRFIELELRYRNRSVDHRHATNPRFKNSRRSAQTANPFPLALTPFGWPLNSTNITRRADNVNVRNGLISSGRSCHAIIVSGSDSISAKERE